MPSAPDSRGEVPRELPHTPLRASTGPAWTVCLALLLILSTAGPFFFGLPVHGMGGTGSDVNFALDLVRNTMTAVRAGDWLPRWLPYANSGLGSPVFYFYGRLPFLIAALLALVVRVSAAAGLVLAIVAFRLLAFFTCRWWLRGHAVPAAADCGALAFVAIPFAMNFNPVQRVGFAEIAATAFVPLLFLLLDQLAASPSLRVRRVVLLSLVYAALAATHLPQTLLAFAVTSVYTLLLDGWQPLLLNAAGAALGLLLSAPSVVPALLLQPAITAARWQSDPTVAMANNFLFTAARFRIYHLSASELYLYSTWLLSLAVLVAFLMSRRARPLLVERRNRALWITSLLSLLAMTELFWPLWLYLPGLRTIQFPWRLFPGEIALTAALIAVLLNHSLARRRAALAALAVLVLAQMSLAVLGAWVSFSHRPQASAVPKVLRFRIPEYVAWREREQPAFAAARRSPPEYIPAGATAAGWRLNDDATALTGPAAPLDLPLPASLHESRSSRGAFELHGTVGRLTTIVLPTFFFPDMRVSGTPAIQPTLDPSTGLTRITLPPGAVAIGVVHDAQIPSVKLGRILCAAAVVLLVVLLLVSLLPAKTPQPPA